MRVKSKVDLWISIFFWLLAAAIAAGVYYVPPGERAIGIAIALPMIFLLLWLIFGTYYELRDDYLYCRSGPFFERIAYEKIKSVRLYHSHLSSLALSAQQIEIRQHNKSYITGTTLISPENREEFLEELRSRCKNLEAVDSKL
jgi:hypothetical protein